MGHYTFNICNDSEVWNAFAAKSPQGTIYCNTHFIEALNVRPDLYFVSKGKEIVAGVIILRNPADDSVLKAPYHFTPYQGILFRDFGKLSVQKRTHYEFSITSFIIDELINIYHKFSLSLSPFINDIRPFQWHNYNHRDKPKFNIDIRYTSILCPVDAESFLMQIRPVRRQEYYKNKAVVIKESEDIELLNSLHRRTFERQRIDRSKEEEVLLKRIAENAIKHDFGKIFIAYLENIPISATLIMYDSLHAYYQFGANDPDYRNLNASTKLLIDNILFMKKTRNINSFDFVGVNSPNRGDYKLSFNGQLFKYIIVRI